MVPAFLYPLGIELESCWRESNSHICRRTESLFYTISSPIHRGFIGGIGGAHLSIALTLTWSELMTSGRGFIAIALVIFSKWHPLRAIVGALLFGAAEALQLQLQARGSGISPFILEMFLYVFTLLVLLIWGGVRRMAAPASLGRVFHGTE